jgi:bacillithiol biosynthesis deacetylase BshB1
VIAFGAHPDDVEIFAGGTVCSLVQRGYRVGIVDLTRGELGSRGTEELRSTESLAAAEIMGVAFRENLGMSDGHIVNSLENRNLIIRILRNHRPDILLIPAQECRHPDHGAAANLIAEASFYSGLRQIRISRGPDSPPGSDNPWRPEHVLHYMQSIPFEPTVVVDVSSVWEQKMSAVQAYHSQVYDPAYEKEDDEPETFVSDPGFMRWIEARARTFGYRIGAEYGEPLLYHHGPMGTDDIVRMLAKTSSQT